MGFVSNLFNGLIESIPVLITKVATIILGIFVVGLFLGYFLGFAGFPTQYLLIPLITLLVMWYKLDEGVMVLLLLLLLVFFYPDLIGLK